MRHINQTIDYRLSGNNSKPIDYRTIDNSNEYGKQEKIDMLLEECKDVINPDYKKWFAKAFQTMEANQVLKLASQAKADGRDPERLFCYLIRKENR